MCRVGASQSPIWLYHTSSEAPLCEFLSLSCPAKNASEPQLMSFFIYFWLRSKGFFAEAFRLKAAPPTPVNWGPTVMVTIDFVPRALSSHLHLRSPSLPSSISIRKVKYVFWMQMWKPTVGVLGVLQYHYPQSQKTQKKHCTVNC